VPIDVQQLDAAARPLADRILDLLQADPTKAFTLYEIIARVEGITEQSAVLILLAETASGPGSTTAEKYAAALAGLEAQGQAKKAMLHGTTYYAFAE
jgi:hypothetical protein